MAITFPIIPHRIAGAKCPGSIVPEEREANGEKSIMLRCNLCGQAMGTINAAVAPALVLKLLDKIVMHRFDEQDEEASVLTSISDECQREEYDRCPGMFHRADAGDQPVFCVHVCHKLRSAGGVSQ